MKKSNAYVNITNLLASGAKNEAEYVMNIERTALSNSEYKESLGNLHFYSKENQKAIPFYEAAMESSQEYDCARYHYLLGVQAEQSGQLTNAFQRYQTAIEIEPEFVDSYIELGGLLCKIEDFEGALQCYTDAIRIDPTDFGIRHNLVQVLSHLAHKDPVSYSQALKDAQAAYALVNRASDQEQGGHMW